MKNNGAPPQLAIDTADASACKALIASLPSPMHARRTRPSFCC